MAEQTMNNDPISRRAKLLYIALLLLAAIALGASILGIVFENFLARFATTTF